MSNGPELPFGMSGSCIVPWDNNTFLVIGGGAYSGRKETYFFHMDNKTMSNGPELLNERTTHACHEIKVNDQEFIVVVGGRKAITSTEVLPKSSYTNGWQYGVEFPITIFNPQIVASKDKQNLYTFGNVKDRHNKEIYKLSCLESINNCAWTKIDTKLTLERYGTVAMRIPNALADKLCQ